MTTVATSLCLKKCSLTIAHTAVSENGTYAVLFDGSGDSASFGTRLPDDLFSNCQSDGGDICFSSDSAGSTQLACEIVAISTSGKTAEIWVAVTLNTTTDVTIYVWYKGSVSLTQPAASATYGSQAVWSTVGSMILVSHDGGLTDSTANALSGTNHSSTSGTGQIGTCRTFDGSSQYIDLGTPTALQLASPMAIECWFKATATGSPTQGIVGNGYLNASTGYGIVLYGGGIIEAQWRNNSTASLVDSAGSTYQNSAWHYAVETRTGNVTTLLADGNSTTNTTAITQGSYSTHAIVGARGDNGTGTTFYFKGSVDELRVRSNAPSANYYATEKNIQSSTSLVTVGTPVSVGSIFRRSINSRVGSRGAA